MATSQETIDALVAANPDRDLIVISAGVSRQLHHRLSVLLRDGQKQKKCTVFLTTRGGDPDGAFRIARCLRHHYEHVRLVIPSFCKSAGTLMAICADELVIGDLGELGPLDVQVRHTSELAARSSGLDIIQALKMNLDHVQDAFQSTLLSMRTGVGLSTKLAGEFAVKVAIGIAEPLYNQIDPNRLGEMQRSLRIAYEYGSRLNKYTNSLREGALDTLVAEYPAHGFVIDRKEAGELFTSVESPTKEEDEFCMTHWGIFQDQTDNPPVFIRVSVTPSPLPTSNHEEHHENYDGNAAGAVPTADNGEANRPESVPGGPEAEVPGGPEAPNGEGR